MSSLGQRLKIKIGMESEKERKKRIALEKKERDKYKIYNEKVRNPKFKPVKQISTAEFKSILFKEATAYFLEMNRQFIVDESNKTFLKCISLYYYK